MYCEFYQLREPPFNVTPDPKFLYLNARYREAIASLNYGITQRKGFITLIGEAGTGKTTLLNKLLEELDTKTKSVFIFNTNVTFEEILEYMFAEFALPVHNGKKLYMLQRLNSFLLEELRGGGNVALLIDEAQDLEFSVLEDLRLLSNLETAKEKILQIVLSGQPELGQKLSNPILRQLRQRIGINCRLLPLSRDEITEYIQYRLQAGGCTDLKLFSREAEEQIYHFSRGIPRLVNVVCDNALVIGYALGKKRIGADVISEAAADLLAVEPSRDDPEERPVEVSAPPPLIAPQSRWRTRLGVIGLVVAAMVLGLLSVGRTVLNKHADGPAAAAPEARKLEVIRPGSEPQGAGIEVASRGGEDGSKPPVREEAVPPSGAISAGNDVANAAPSADQIGDSRDNGLSKPSEVRGGEVAVPKEAPPLTALANHVAPSQGRPAGRSDAQKIPLDRGATEQMGSAAQKAIVQPAQPATLTSAPMVAGPAKPLVVAAVPKESSAKAEQLEAPSAATGLPPSPNVAGSDDGTASSAENGPASHLDGVNFENVIVRNGDSMSQIAVRKYGQASYTILDLLKLANPELADIDVIAVGQTIRLPELGEGFPVLNDGAGHYALLVFSTPQAHRADSFERVLRGRGLDTRVLVANVGSQKRMYRVVLSGFKDRDEVVAAGRQLQRLFREDTRVAQLGE
ncbi:MAG TPA: AAA family ATPase [Candidatus Margulisiibacteriota bacterium]|nr:AAA family ATPase [Candidatus Margulisiibacteriota bacterium]